MRYTISQDNAEEILNRGYNLTKVRKISTKNLIKK